LSIDLLIQTVDCEFIVTLNSLLQTSAHQQQTLWNLM